MKQTTLADPLWKTVWRLNTEFPSDPAMCPRCAAKRNEARRWTKRRRSCPHSAANRHQEAGSPRMSISGCMGKQSGV